MSPPPPLFFHPILGGLEGGGRCDAGLGGKRALRPRDAAHARRMGPLRRTCPGGKGDSALKKEDVDHLSSPRPTLLFAFSFCAPLHNLLFCTRAFFYTAAAASVFLAGHEEVREAHAAAARVLQPVLRPRAFVARRAAPRPGVGQERRALAARSRALAGPVPRRPRKAEAAGRRRCGLTARNFKTRWALAPRARPPFSTHPNPRSSIAPNLRI